MQGKKVDKLNTAITYSSGFCESDLPVGGVLEIRDFTPFLKMEQICDDSDSWGEDGKWSLKDYRLLDGTAGRMLAVNYKTGDCDAFDGRNMPPEFEIRLPLKGKYAIYIGVPLLDWRPVLAGTGAAGGVDIALDGETFINVAPEYGIRRGKILEETGREIYCYFESASMEGRNIHIRVPFGTFHSLPLGLVRASLSCLRLERLPEDCNVESYRPGTEETGEQPRPLIMVCDGFSHYFEFGKPGECMDLRLPQAYKNSDVKIFMTQVSGPALWKSDVTSYFGEGITEEEYKGKRSGDRRMGTYVDWSVKNHQEALRLQTEQCHAQGAEMHFSIRANLFFVSENGDYMSSPERFMNGRWWMENPDARRKTKNKHKLDYNNPKTRLYYLSLFLEAMKQFDIDGINFDFTRWPPILDIEKDDVELFFTVVREVRQMVDSFNEKNGRHLKFSMTFVDGFHANCSLEEQLIDFEALMEEKLLDFVCVQAWDIKKYSKIAHRYGIPFFAVQDGDSIYYRRGWREDPLWVLPNGVRQDDPCAGEEFLDQPDIRSCLTPLEMGMAFNKYYDEGADGVFIVNHFLGDLTFRDGGHPGRVRERVQKQEIYGQQKGQYLFLTERCKAGETSPEEVE